MQKYDETKIEVKINGVEQSGGRISYGKADVLHKEYGFGSSIWEVKHKSQYSMGPSGTGKKQLNKYINAINADLSIPKAPLSITSDEYRRHDYIRDAFPGESFTSFFIPYGSNYLLVEYDQTAAGVVLYQKYTQNERKEYLKTHSDTQTLTNGEAIDTYADQFMRNLVITTAVVAVAVVIIGGAIVVLPYVGVGAGGAFVAVGSAGAGEIVRLAEKAAEEILTHAA